MIEMLKDLYAVLVTPFKTNGEIDDASLDSLVEFYLERKVHGLVILSVMGEGALLSEFERIRVATRVLSRVKNRVPVVVGVSGNGAKIASTFGHRLVDLGASALLVAPPLMSTPSLDIVANHYNAVASATRVPIVVLDYPPLAGKMPVSFLKRLVDEIEFVCAVKLEDLPTSVKITQIRAAVGNRLRVFGGLGGVYCLQELERGSDGLMTGYAYPEHLQAILNKFRAGDLAGAFEEYKHWLPLLIYEGQFSIGIALRKEILRQRGAIACAAVRSPTATIDEQTCVELGRVLTRVGTQEVISV